MGKYLDAIELSKDLKNRLEEVVLGNIGLRDDNMQNQIGKIIKSTKGLISDILIEGVFLAKRHDTILRDIPFLDKKFLDLLDLNKEFDADFYPFKHQYETLRISNEASGNKPAIAVTAPTGSGKTESFLFPMLHDLISHPRQKNETGVRAIILYPMNALVVDQNRRLFSYLKGQSNLRMFFYNSETPEIKKYADDEFVDKCFVKTRKEARDNPPDIMITNYSMLEYILSRPTDFPLIGNGLRTVIVDEAHLYTGALAAEVSLLLRRVVAKAKIDNSKILYIATTATISQNQQEQYNFFSKFFNKESIEIVVGEKEFKKIALDTDVNSEIEKFKDISSMVKKSSLDLYNELKDYKIFSKILKILSEKYIIRLEELSNFISKSLDKKTLLNIFTIGAKARLSDNELPLLPHKLHLQVRSSQGFSVCINPNCSGSKIKGMGKIHHGTFYNCTICHSPTLNLIRCSECGEHFFYGKFDDKDSLHFENFFKSSLEEESDFVMGFKNSKRAIYVDKDGKKCSLHKYNNKFYQHKSCPVCSNNEFNNLSISDQFIIPLVSETMLTNMPEIDKEINKFLPAKGRRLLAFSDSRSEAARLGPLLTSQHETQLFRRLLIDTVYNSIEKNQNADLIGYYQNELERNEGELLSTDNPFIKEEIKKVVDEIKIKLSRMNLGVWIAQLVENMGKNPIVGEFFDREKMRKQYADEREQLSYDKNIEAIKKNLYNRVVEALITPNTKDINLESIGLIKLFYPNIKSLKLSYKIVNLFSKKARELEECKIDILNQFLYIFRSYKCITSEYQESQLKDYEISNIGLGQFVSFDAKNKNLFNLKVTSRSYVYKFVKSILESFEIQNTQDNIHTFLEGIHETFLDASKKDDIRWLEYKKVQADDERVVEAFRVVFYELSIEIPKTFYLNTINNTIWHNAINGLVPEKNSKVELKKVTQKKLDGLLYFSRYRKMYLQHSKELSMGLWAEEHSAQLAPKENRRLQDLFIKGKRNMLSATTTLEVGIDIGGLSGVLMANVPPNKANYIQRSGRSGRRTDGSSITLAYTKTRHFDQNVFRNFKFYLEKPHKKLTISLEKKKIGIRHFNSLMLSKFYEKYTNSKSMLIIDSFKKMGYFIGVCEIPKYTDSNYSKIEYEIEENSIFNSFISFLDNYKINSDDMKTFDEIFKHTTEKFDYKLLIKGFSKQVKNVCGLYAHNLKGLYEDWNFVSNASHKNAIRYNIKQKHGKSIIEIFSNAQILPKYGFPIDIKTLQVINDDKIFNLTRGSFLALSEYVPGSKILAGGMLVESKGVSKHFTGKNLDEAFGEKGFMYMCDKGHFFTSSHLNVHHCITDGCGGVVSPASNYLMPEHGYITSASKPLSFKSQAPEKIGKLEIRSAICTNQKNDIQFNYNDFTITYKEKALIYGINRGNKRLGFAICTKCGYCESEVKKVTAGSHEKLSKTFKNHPSIYNKSPANVCLEEPSAIWRNYNLMAKMVTDAIMIVPKRDINDIDVVQTLANAMHLSGAEELGIDEREINALVQEVDERLSILIYDNQSGGVGYVYDLAANRWDDWIKKTKERLYVDEKHHKECLNGCIKCIVTMNTNRPLPRKKTLDYLNNKLQNIVADEPKIIKEDITQEARLKRFKKSSLL